MKKAGGHIPIVLVATKVDLRPSAMPQNRITTSEGENLKRKIGAVAFLECSAKEHLNIDEVINTALQASDGLLKAEPDTTIRNIKDNFSFKCCCFKCW